MGNLSKSAIKRFVDMVVDFAKLVPFVYFVVGGTIFAVALAFSLFALQYYLFFGTFLPPSLLVAGIITPLLTAFVCFYFTALIIQKLIRAERSLENYNFTLQEQVLDEVEKRQQKERLLVQQSKMALMGEMIGAIAHQWRQPLNALGLTVQDMKYAYKFGELNADYIDNAVESAMKQISFMSKTIDDFRNFFSPNKEKKEFCIEDAINAALHIVGAELANKEISVMLDTGSKHFMFGYEGEFQQVILNLLSNAKDAILQKNPQNKYISFLIEEEDSNTSIIIEDSGGGIDAAIIDRIYEPYFTTKEQGEGTGIGLYMSKQIIERHIGGSLIAENSKDGAKFTVRLPRNMIAMT